MKFTLGSGNTYDCDIQFSRYSDENKNLSMRLIGSSDSQYPGEPIASCSLNLPIKLPDDEMFIKDYSENQGMVNELIKNDIIEIGARRCELLPNCCINSYKLSEKGIQLRDEWFKNYEKHEGSN